MMNKYHFTDNKLIVKEETDRSDIIFEHINKIYVSKEDHEKILDFRAPL